MFCKECGKPIDEGHQFCDHCGTKVAQSDKHPINEEASVIEGSYTETEEQVYTDKVDETPIQAESTASELSGTYQETHQEDIQVEAASQEVTEANSVVTEEVQEEIQEEIQDEIQEEIALSQSVETVEAAIPVKPNKKAEKTAKRAEKIAKHAEAKAIRAGKKADKHQQDFGHDADAMPKKKHRLKFLAWLIPVVLLLGFGVFSYLSIYTSVTDYDDMIGRASRWHFYSDRAYNNNLIELTVPLDSLNAYINDDVIDEIELKGYTVETVCFGQGGKLYFQVSKDGGNTVDIVADYDVQVYEDQLTVSVRTKRLGRHIPVVSTVVLSTQYDIRELIIPLETDFDDLEDQIIVAMMMNAAVSPSTRGDDWRLDYDMTVGLVDDDAVPVAEEQIPTPEAVMNGQEARVTVNQAYLMADVLKNDIFLEEIEGTIAEGTYLINGNHEVLLRKTDDISGAMYDVVLTFDYDYDSETLRLEEAKLVGANTTDEALKASLISVFEDVLPMLEPAVFRDYQVIGIDGGGDALTFVIDQAPWTIMVYMNGSDLESYGGSATEDLNEMMDGLTNDNIRVIIETGGTSYWYTDEIDPSQNQRFTIEDGELVHLMDLGERNICDPDTLEDFIAYSVENYPSDRYALLFWNHGGGAMYGFGYDENYPYDSLTLDEMGEALANVVEDHDIHLEVVGFDACLMATIETAEVFSEYSDYFIASEENEPAYGWDYIHIFEGLSNGEATDGDSFGKLVVAGFIEDSINKNEEELLTLSVVDLSKMDTLVLSVEELFDAISADGYQNGFDRLSRIIPQIKAFGGNTAYSGYTDHYDLENLAKKLTEFWPLEANNVIAAIDDAVVYKLSGYLAADAGGLSMYLPFYDLYSSDISDDYAPVSFSAAYTEFMDDFVAYKTDVKDEVIDFDYAINTNVDPYEITFDPDYMDYISEVYLNVYMVYEDEDGYDMVDLGMDAWVVETDDPYTYREGFNQWAAIDGWQVPLWINYENDDYIEYETPILLNGEYVMMISAWRYDEERYVVYGARPLYSGGEGIQDRNIIEFEEGDTIILLYDVYNMGDEDYTIYEWESDPIIVGAEEVPIMEDYEFETGYSYAVQFVIVDYNGDFTYTEYVTFTYTD